MKTLFGWFRLQDLLKEAEKQVLIRKEIIDYLEKVKLMYNSSKVLMFIQTEKTQNAPPQQTNWC